MFVLRLRYDIFQLSVLYLKSPSLQMTSSQGNRSHIKGQRQTVAGLLWGQGGMPNLPWVQKWKEPLRLLLMSLLMGDGRGRNHTMLRLTCRLWQSFCALFLHLDCKLRACFGNHSFTEQVVGSWTTSSLALLKTNFFLFFIKCVL